MRLDRLMSLPERDEIEAEKHSEETITFMKQCVDLKEKVGQSISVSIDKISKYEEITGNLSIVDEATKQL